MTLWMVRSGRYGESENLALEKNVAVIDKLVYDLYELTEEEIAVVEGNKPS